MKALVAIGFIFISCVAMAEKVLDLPVPSSELPLDRYMREERATDASTFELAVSSWAPADFTRSSYSHERSALDTVSLPQISLNHLGLMMESKPRVFSKLGFAFMNLKREQRDTRPGATDAAAQNLLLVSLRFGFELQGPVYLKNWVRPFAGASVLPTMALAAKSQIEDSVSEFGAPVEVVAGVAVYPPFSALFENSALGVNVQYITGTIDGSQLDGVGAQGFFRVSL